MKRGCGRDESEVPGAGGPGEGRWQPATRQESNKTDKRCQDTQIPRPLHHHHHHHILPSRKHTSPEAAAAGTTPTHPHTHHPSISSLEGWTALIEHSSVYRSRLPIGFWINGIIFLIKQDGAQEGEGGRKGGTGLWVCE